MGKVHAVCCCSFAVEIASLSLLVPLAGAQTWDVSGDLSVSSNPAGPWAYGSKSLAAAPQLYTDAAAVSAHYGSIQVDGWSRPGAALPYVLQNVSATVWNYDGTSVGGGTIALPPDAVLLHPHFTSNLATVVQWTAPSAGFFSVQAHFERVEQFQNRNADYHIQLNGVDFPGGSGLLTGFGLPASEASFNTPALLLNAGDRLEFVVGYGTDGTSDTDAVTLAATIAAVPEPAAFGMMALAAVVGFGWRRRA